jgi:tetratricopeptide (TPR) repeat protein
MEIPSLKEFLNNAQTAYEGENYDEAALWYERAETAFQDAGDPLNAAEMANNRSVALLRAGKAQKAFQAAKGTDTTFAQAGDERRQAIALGNQAAAVEAMGKLDEAIQLFQQSNQILKQANHPALRIFVLQSLSALYLRRWRFIEALVAMEAALDLKDKLSLREKFLKKLLGMVSKLLGR